MLRAGNGGSVVVPPGISWGRAVYDTGRLAAGGVDGVKDAKGSRMRLVPRGWQVQHVAPTFLAGPGRAAPGSRCSPDANPARLAPLVATASAFPTLAILPDPAHDFRGLRGVEFRVNLRHRRGRVPQDGAGG